MISDFSGSNLLEMPTARFAPEGEFAFTSGRVSPYFTNAVTVQPVPWLEGVLHYTDIQNRLYGPKNFSGGQHYIDKGFDLKLRLLEESSSFPQVAVGFRDIAGTGLFSSEFIVLSRRYYDLDFTLGLGWGNMGTRGQIPNPFGLLSSRFKTRTIKAGEGGNITGQYFRGERASIIGGIAYRTPISGLTIKLELDGNRYQSEPLGNQFKVASPVNLGLTYSYNDWLDLSVGVERGNTLMAQIELHSNLHKSSGMPKFDPPPEKIKLRDLSADVAAARPRTAIDGKDPAQRLTQALEAQGYQVDGVSIEGRRATVVASQGSFRSAPRAVGRAAGIMANEAPPEVEELRYVNLEAGLESSRVTLLRKDLENAAQYQGSPEEIGVHARVEAPGRSRDIPDRQGRYPYFDWNWSPAMRHQIGGPDSPYFYQIFLRLEGELQLTRGLSASGAFAFDIHNNFDSLKLPSDSQLPHVRSDIKNYLKQGKNGVNRLELDYLTNLGSNWYGRASAGIFEEMFGGIGTEVLYKPFGQRWALGADINRVRQRDYDERFDFRSYKITTGHADYYYQLPYYNTLAQVSVGRYLAGDKGITLDLSRRFDSGVVLGAFVTRTNVSAAQFGEGSFDKGIYISIPIDMLSFYSSRSSMGMTWHPLTRDGGQRLVMGKRLYPLLHDSGPEALTRDWAQLLD